MASLLPSHTQRSIKRSFFPRSRISTFVALLLGSITLYSFYHLSDQRYPAPWRHPQPPPSIFDNTPPIFDGPLPEPAGPETEDKSAADKLLWKARANDVKSSFLHAWEAYEHHAWGADEIRPLSGVAVDNFNGWGVSIVDSLDTLLLMDLRPQFARAMDHVASINFNQTQYDVAPFFETIIRYLGGLLSAYALVVDEGETSAITWRPEYFPYRPLKPKPAEFDADGELIYESPAPAEGMQSQPIAVDDTSVELADPEFDKRDIAMEGTSSIAARTLRKRYASVLLSRADHLARALMPAFNTTSGLPVYGVNTVNGKTRDNWSSLLAEIGSCQMEYKYLAYLTGRREFFDIVNNVTNVLEDLQEKQMNNTRSTRYGGGLGGMLPTHYSVETGTGTDSYVSVGAMADSAYEYFLKGYLLSNRSEPRLLEMYLHSVDSALHNLTYVSPERELVYITDAYGSSPSHKMEHLSCFYPGLLALGIENLNSNDGMNAELPADVRERHRWAAESIAETCWVLYADNPSGLGSEEVVFDRPLVLYKPPPTPPPPPPRPVHVPETEEVPTATDELPPRPPLHQPPLPADFKPPPRVPGQPHHPAFPEDEAGPPMPPYMQQADAALEKRARVPAPAREQWVPVDSSNNRWWDIVDKWEAEGRLGGSPPGLQGIERKPIVTNGGKGKWETTKGKPSGNERPLPKGEVDEEEMGPGKLLHGVGRRPKVQHTHLRDYGVRDDRWLMRPETIESLYLMYRLTKDQMWRDRCYGIYQAMEKHSRTKLGYASAKGTDYDIDPVTGKPRVEEIDPNSEDAKWAFRFTYWTRWEDEMPSYALAETFKYLYLCMLDPEESAALLPSDKWVFNTEAHPLPVFEWSELERTEWNIR